MEFRVVLLVLLAHVDDHADAEQAPLAVLRLAEVGVQVRVEGQQLDPKKNYGKFAKIIFRARKSTGPYGFLETSWTRQFGTKIVSKNFHRLHIFHKD